ncbi:Type I phosphodiesterase / nucleotide pyrophosphatase [Sphingobacterium nematocida]|uniref:Type I phosphodiesterase / nucleotide pyrophosphatase n=1 Tax=Sphingobacterium nematocida TaxID=1513896 RepID=A0A1T5GGZ2_9SPHI|nr:LamG-like jellyroll fold domain-containing protein [Sphingobacterium nematocida]SKC07669.1 Type I phosphodiesterase / nucleotide pyrophosphatase [Sphingobacterium nematocida]
MKKKNLSIISFAFVLVLGLSGCTKYFNPEPKFEEYEQEIEKSVQRKVLMISLDGLVGKELSKKIPANISALMKTGKYSFEALTDENTSDPATWTTMMTGYSSSKHLVLDESFLPAPSSDDPHGETNFAPSFIYRMEEQNSKLRTSIIVQDPGVANVLLMDADDNVLVDSDEKVKDEAIALLAKTDPDFLLLQFKDILNAGKENGFSMESSTYEEAVSRVDGYLGAVVEALKTRENIAYENWLIILTSNHGGVGKSYGGDSFQERNIFSLYGQMDLGQEELVPEIISSPQFYGYDGQESGPTEGVRARNVSEVAGEEQYNVARTGQLTIEAKIKVNRNASGNWSYSVPPFLSKVTGRTGTTPGWSFFRSGNNVVFYCADGAQKLEISGGPASTDDKWCHISATVESKDGVVISKLFVNGAKAAEATGALNINEIKSTSPLTFGFQPYVFLGGFLDCHIADVHIWNVALTEDEVKRNANRIGVSETDPKINNVIGYWPMNDGGGILKNKVVGMPNIPLQGKYQYKVSANNLPFVNEKAILVQNLDIATNVLYWLGLKPHETWVLEGQAFLSKFELEFLK